MIGQTPSMSKFRLDLSKQTISQKNQIFITPYTRILKLNHPLKAAYKVTDLGHMFCCLITIKNVDTKRQEALGF